MPFAVGFTDIHGDIAETHYVDSNGRFTWVDGRPPTFTRWYVTNPIQTYRNGEPPRSGCQNCRRIWAVTCWWRMVHKVVSTPGLQSSELLRSVGPRIKEVKSRSNGPLIIAFSITNHRFRWVLGPVVLFFQGYQPTGRSVCRRLRNDQDASTQVSPFVAWYSMYQAHICASRLPMVDQ